MNHRILYLALLLATCWLLASCRTTQPLFPEVPPVSRPIVSGTPAFPDDLRGAQLFRISPEATTLHILVYRGGTMATLGHNHVISSRSVNGFIWRHEQPYLSGFDIALPVNDLIVDDNDARGAEGSEFPLNVPESARQGTRHNMLSEALLDGETYPVIRLQSANVSGDTDAPHIVVHVTIKNQIHLYTLPVTVKLESTTLHVRGEFSIRQTDFGIKPYSVAMGALQVLDELKVKFDLQAEAVDPAQQAQNIAADDDSAR